MSPILITSCSNRKIGNSDDRLKPSHLKAGSLEDVSRNWRQSLKKKRDEFALKDLYVGRGASESRNSAHLLNAEHWFISAGLGLVSANEKAPGYDLTIAGSSASNVQQYITDEFTPQMWWNELAKRHRPKRLIATLVKDTRGIVIFAIPSNYLNMIADDLACLTDSQMSRIRIIGPIKAKVPDDFHDFILPYDERLDGKDSPLPGTRSDFPQRAAHHFSKYIWPNVKDHHLSTHKKMVFNALKGMRYPNIPKRESKTDEEIINIIIKNWNAVDGYSGKMLRLLRDNKHIACEQKRFSLLFHKAKKLIEMRQ